MYKKKSSINIPAAKKQLPVNKLIKCIFHRWVYAALGTKTQVFAFFVKKSCIFTLLPQKKQLPVDKLIPETDMSEKVNFFGHYYTFL